MERSADDTIDPAGHRFGVLEIKVDGIDRRVGELEKLNAVAAIEMKHMSKALDGVLWWLRWVAILVLGGFLSAVANLVIRLPG